MSHLGNRIGRLCRRYDFKAQGFKKFRAYTNWARSNFDMLRRSSRVKARPLKLTIDTVNACQLRCPLCPTGLQAHDRKTATMDMDQFRRLMEEVGDYVFVIDFYNWGEPLLNKHIDEFIGLARSYRITTELSSNLSFKLSDERLRQIVASGLNELIVSLDGASQETYGQYRRRGDFDLVIENMRRLIALKREMGSPTPAVTWRYLVFGFNEHEVPRAREMAQEIGVDRLVVTPAYLDEGYYPVPDQEKELMKTWSPTAPEYQMYDRWENGVFVPKARGGSVPTRCDWHYMSAAINADGGVAPCCVLFKQKDDFGALGRDGSLGLMDVLNRDKFVTIRDKFAGRRTEATGLVCERCPATNIMGYARGVNIDIALLTLANVRRLFRRAFGRRSSIRGGIQGKA